MKTVIAIIASIGLSSCAYASWIEPNPSNEWRPLVELQAGFSSLGDHASIGSVGGFKAGASNDAWELAFDYSRNDATLNDNVDFTLHNVGVSADRVFKLGFLEARAGVGVGYTLANLGNSPDASFWGGNGVNFTYGAGIGYHITDSLYLGLSVKEQVFNTEVRKTVKKDSSEPIFQDGTQIGTVETETLETTSDQVNFNQLQTLLSLQWRF